MLCSARCVERLPARAPVRAPRGHLHPEDRQEGGGRTSLERHGVRETTFSLSGLIFFGWGVGKKVFFFKKKFLQQAGCSGQGGGHHLGRHKRGGGGGGGRDQEQEGEGEGDRLRDLEWGNKHIVKV